MRIRAAALAGFVALLAASAARAETPRVALLSPFTPARTTPPLQASRPGIETRFFGRLTSTQAVTVSINRSGRPLRVVDVDRIVVARKGDYSFAIVAPVDEVRAAPGSASEPGLRTGAVVWQGFSPGRRVLAAAITLETGPAAASLPLRVQIDGSAVRLENSTTGTVPTTDAPTVAADVARALDASRAALIAKVPAPAAVVKALGPSRNLRIRSFVPLRVRGSVRFAGEEQPQRVANVVGSTPLELRGEGAVRAIELSIEIPEPAGVLRPPGAQRWVDLVRSGRLRDGRAVTRLAEERLLGAALATQFRQFLANPDLSGTTRTSYRYVLAESMARRVAGETGSDFPWLELSIGIGALAAVLGGAVLWAHS